MFDVRVRALITLCKFFKRLLGSAKGWYLPRSLVQYYLGRADRLMTRKAQYGMIEPPVGACLVEVRSYPGMNQSSGSWPTTKK